MRVIITQLDGGFTISVTVPAMGDRPEEKRRFAFESAGAMHDYLHTLIPNPRLAEMEQAFGEQA